MSERQSRAHSLVLEGRLTLRTIETTHVDLSRALHEYDELELDCRGITEVDLSLLQLLLAARRSAEQAGKTLTLTSAADGALLGAAVQGGFVPDHDAMDEPGATRKFWLGNETVR